MPIKNLMKTIVIFYDEDSKYSKEKAFKGKSAVELTNEWAQSLNLPSFTVKSATLTDLLCDMKEICSKENAENVVFSFIDLPFLNKELSQKILDFHINYKAEYTFADGYPYGFAPEALNAGTIGILAELSKSTQKTLGEQPVTRESIYNLIKTDINSFDVETVISDTDWRLLRLAFHCGKKDNFVQCKALTQASEAAGIEEGAGVEDLSALAAKNPACLKTIPGFYNIQIADAVSYDSVYLPYFAAYTEKNKTSPLAQESTNLPFMPFDKCSNLIEKIAAFSENAVISLSAWGEPLYHPDFLKIVEKILSYRGLSVFLETDGQLVNPELCQKLAEIAAKAEKRSHQWQKIMIAVSLDAVTEATYQKLHKKSPEGAFQKAVNALAMLQQALPGCVYPQFVRMNENEEELEAFYRYWNEKTNPSGGNLIIQKYDDFAGLLPPCKPADLSPLERDPCWHLRRDLTILTSGEVPLCRACVLAGSHCGGKSAGNVFVEELEEIWHKSDRLLENHIKKNYSENCVNCEKCDEWYTFNF